MLKTLPHADYVFANEDEAAEFGKTQKMEGASLNDIAVAIAKLPKSNKQRPRVAIVTHGAKPVIVASNMPGSDEVSVKEYPIKPLAKD